MCHIAIINQDNIVINVAVVPNSKMQIDGVDNIELAIAHLTKCYSTPEFKGGLYHLPRKEDGSMYQLSDVDFIQTSYHENIRYNFAGVGDTWDSENEAFIKPYPAETPMVDIGIKDSGMSMNATSSVGSWQLNNKFKWEFVESNLLE